MLQYSDKNNITDNNASNSLDYPEGYHSSGIKIENSNDNIISNNIVFSNIAGGIDLSNSDYNNISNNAAKFNGREGIYLSFSNFSLIRNNSVKSNTGNGILLQDSNNNNITEITLQILLIILKDIIPAAFV